MSHYQKFWSYTRIVWQCIRMCGKKGLDKRKPSEVNLGPYNTVILKLLKFSMSLQFVTGVYVMLAYLT